ncbi:MAG: hypothetical protein ACKN9U_25675, partial [Pirellulaceae bacterium]
MTAQSFDHERLDVYRLSIDYVARSFEAAQPLEGLYRHARDQVLQVVVPARMTEQRNRSINDTHRVA